MKIALSNLPMDEGLRVARVLVEEHVAACINVYPIQSVYFWQGELQLDEEAALVMKVAREGVSALKQRLCELHPYEVPEFVVLDVDNEASLTEFVDFVRSGTHT